jgi:uncharacterized protein (TIGR02302 family)
MTDPESKPGLPRDVRRRLWLSWVAVTLERFWPALWPSSGVVGLFLILALLNVFPALPAGLHTLALLGFLGALGWSLYWPVRDQTIPGRAQALRHLETSSGLEHRPITGLDDKVAIKPEPGLAQSLWAAHRKQLFDRIRNLKIRWPDVNLAIRDPYALRVLVLIVLVAAGLYAGTDAPRRLLAAFDTTRAQTPWNARGDAWIKPPAYTGEETRTLALGKPEGRAVSLNVPVNSELIVRIHQGAGSAELRTGPYNSAVPDPQAIRFKDVGNGASEARIVLERDISVRLSMSGQAAGFWRIRTVPDAAPEIAFRTPLAVMPSQTLRFHYGLKDEYGVATAAAKVQLQTPPAGAKPDQQEYAFELPLPPKPARLGESTIFKDLTAHRWAGQAVSIVLEAKDGAGQIGRTAPVKIKLPERNFQNPLARSLIEQRKSLVAEPRSRDDVAKVLDALAVAPEMFTPDLVIYLGLRVAHFRLKYARDGEDLQPAEELLWDLAVRADDGAVADAQAELRRIQEKLAQAISKGASDEEIAQLMQQLRQAMQNYLEAMQAQGMTPQQSQASAGQAMNGQDLKAMLDKIETLARSGSAEAAQQMLTQLQAIMESLKTARQSGTAQEQSAQSAMNALKQMMKQQSELMDKTFREQTQSASGDMRTQQLQRAQALAREQEAMSQALSAMMRQMMESGGNPQPLQNAQNAMNAAAQSLREGAFGDAQGRQARALEDLRRSGEALMQAMQAMASQKGGMGAGDGMGAGENQDPFGRTGPSFGPQTGGNVKVPSQMDIQRAREILEELQRRAGDRGRPENELEYLERLLRRF